jgi:A/G-specific adenine glycosylase
MFSKLIEWSHSKYNDLPWREERSLYTTLVSEIMLQQTTVATVRNHYKRFIKQFPNLMSLKKASEEELTIAWKGLGYYRRARNLKKAATYLVDHHQGEFPLEVSELIKAPGIGDYTANALVAIGANQRGLALDANLERVLSRLYHIDIEKGPKLTKHLYQLFHEGKILANETSYRDLNEALMDLGRNICQARRAQCDLCPFKLALSNF